MLLALLAGTVSACGDDDESGCRGLDSDHDGLVYKCGGEEYDAGHTPPPSLRGGSGGSGSEKDAGGLEQDAGNDDENDAGRD